MSWMDWIHQTGRQVRQCIKKLVTLLRELSQRPNMRDWKVTISLDKKLDAMNKKLALLAQQQRETNNKLHYLIQLVGSTWTASMYSAHPRIDLWVDETFTAEPLTSQPPMQEVSQPVQSTSVPISVPMPAVSTAMYLLPQIPTSLPAPAISASMSFQPYIPCNQRRLSPPQRICRLLTLLWMTMIFQDIPFQWRNCIK